MPVKVQTRQCLRLLLEAEEDIEVVEEAGDGQDAIDQASTLSPDVIVMDIIMPDLNGIDATRKIVEEFPGTKVIALSGHSDRQFVVGMFKAGALGYLLKDCVLDELVPAIRAVLNNQTYLNLKLARPAAPESG